MQGSNDSRSCRPHTEVVRTWVLSHDRTYQCRAAGPGRSKNELLDDHVLEPIDVAVAWRLMRQTSTCSTSDTTLKRLSLLAAPLNDGILPYVQYASGTVRYRCAGTLRTSRTITGEQAVSI